MAGKEREHIRLVLNAVKRLGPDGALAADELERMFDKMVPKSGGTFTGSTGYMAIIKEPDPQRGCFGLYVFDNNGTIELRAKGQDGENTVLATSS